MYNIIRSFSYTLILKHFYMEKGTQREIKTSRGMISATYSPIEVVAVREHAFRKDVDQAELRQTVTRHYPGARPYNSNTQAIFEISEFGFESQDHEGVRVAWINVPKGKTVQDIEKQLAKYPDATIYRILADDVKLVLSEEQLFAAKSSDFPDYDLNKAMLNHVVIQFDDNGVPCAISSAGEFMEDAVLADENGKALEILKEDKLQYISKGFNLTWCDDVDLREAVERISSEEPVASAEAVEGDPAKQTV